MKLHRILIACLSLVIALRASGAYTPPQVQALHDLEAVSTSPVRVGFRFGFPSSVTMTVYRPGTTTSEVDAAKAFLAQYAALYGLDQTEIELRHIRADDLPGDGKLVRFAELYRGFLVIDAEIVVHVRMAGTSAFILGTQGMLMFAAENDRIDAEVLEVGLVPAVSPEAAEAAARAALGLPAAEVVGETELFVYDPRIVDGPGAPRLVWRVTLQRVAQVFIDALTSEVLETRSMGDRSDGLDDYDLELEDMQNAGSEGEGTADGVSIGDEDGMDSNALTDNDAVLAWFAARDTYLMFHDRFGRHSYDSDDAEIQVRVHTVFMNAPQLNAKAISADDSIEFSTGWVATDVMGHEMGHLVINETSALQGDQPGSLNESFGDIMGLLTDPNDWKIGETAPAIGVNGVRNFQLASPNKYSNLVPTNDPHVNANIINKAFYLMIAGGTFNGRDVVAMGLDKAGWIAYLTFPFLPSNAWFGDERNRAVTVATDLNSLNLLGFTPQDICTVRNAFRAVEIGQGDANCDGVEDNTADSDGDGWLDDGDFSGSTSDNPCHPEPSIWGLSGFNCDDNCTSVANPNQKDYDGDGDGDLCDTDADNDGWPNGADHCPGPGNSPDSDGDGVYDCLDDDVDGDGIVNVNDNCPGNPNPGQQDVNNNGIGDDCDLGTIDVDGDGLYMQDDNCTFVPNSGQADTDGDDLGDACDLCPTTPDWDHSYNPGFMGGQPFPHQPDSDGDGTPDACDTFGYAGYSVFNQGGPYAESRPIRVDNTNRTIQVSGPAGAGGRIRLAFPACGTSAPLASAARVELRLSGMPATLGGWVEDDSGRRVARIGTVNQLLRGARFRPRCDRGYALVVETQAGFTGSASFQARAFAVVPTGPNPFVSTAGQFITPPTRPPDQDGDGFFDAIDSCPADYDPSGDDLDGDGVGDVCDNCPVLANATQQPVAFETVRALDRQTFGWTSQLAHNWVSGSLAALHSGSPFAILGPGGTGTGNTFAVALAAPACSGTGCWMLWKHAPGGCGTWGSSQRDGALPTYCTIAADCGAGEACIGGRCVDTLLGAASP